MRNLHKHRKAFTMIELVFVIVVLGIIASLALPRMDRDLRQEAADNILSAIRYTQHLALNDDKTNPSDPNWQKELWTIQFSPDGAGRYFYTISSDTDKDGTVTDPAVDPSEVAIDPINGKYMYTSDSTIDANESPNIFLGKKYGINDVDFTNCQTIANGADTSKHIAFDQLGRPHKGIFVVATNDYRTVMTGTCTIKFSFEDGSDDLIISIAEETGYADIL